MSVALSMQKSKTVRDRSCCLKSALIRLDMSAASISIRIRCAVLMGMAFSKSSQPIGTQIGVGTILDHRSKLGAFRDCCFALPAYLSLRSPWGRSWSIVPLTQTIHSFIHSITRCFADWWRCPVLWPIECSLWTKVLTQPNKVETCLSWLLFCSSCLHISAWGPLEGGPD